MDYNQNQLAPIIGEFYTKSATNFFPEEQYPTMVLSTIELTKRFVVKIGDDGLAQWGVNPGDYLVFRQQGWPTEHGQLCFIHFGDDAILRIIPDMWETEIDLITANDEYAPISTQRNQFIVTGVCCGIKRKDSDIKIVNPEYEY